MEDGGRAPAVLARQSASVYGERGGRQEQGTGVEGEKEDQGAGDRKEAGRRWARGGTPGSEATLGWQRVVTPPPPPLLYREPL